MAAKKNHRMLVVIWGATCLASNGILLSFAFGPSIEPHDFLELATLLPFVVAARLVPLSVGYKRTMIADTAPIFAVALLVPPGLAGLAIFLAVALAERSRNWDVPWRAAKRASYRQTLFNASQATVGVLAAGSVFGLAGDAGGVGSPDGSTFLTMLLAAVSMFLASDLMLLAVVSAQLGRKVIRTWWRDRAQLPYDAALYICGFVVAFSANLHLWVVPVMAPLVVVFYKAMRTQVLLRTQTREAIEALADTVDERDPYTFEHSKRVAEYCRGTLKHLSVPHDLAEEIVAAARVHDVGKIGVRDAVLLKPGKLTDEEFDEIKQHPDIGARILSRFPDFGRGTSYVRHHHERYDGSGYPMGLKGRAIPFGARVIAVADTYDAMTSNRIYRENLGEANARDEMGRVAGSQLDPQVVVAFFKHKGWELPERLSEVDAVAMLAGIDRAA